MSGYNYTPANLSKGGWLLTQWHPLCGITYLIICLMDFVVMPAYTAWMNARYDPVTIVDMVTKLSQQSQVEALQILHQQTTWAPITLQSSGLIHIAFGAILGVGIWSKNSGTTQIETAISQTAVSMAQPGGQNAPPQINQFGNPQ